MSEMVVQKTLTVPVVNPDAALRRTIQAMTDAKNFLAGVVFQKGTVPHVYELQDDCYYDVRKRFQLKSQMAVNALRQVVGAYKTDRQSRRRSQRQADRYRQRAQSNPAREKYWLAKATKFEERAKWDTVNKMLSILMSTMCLHQLLLGSYCLLLRL